MVETLIGLVAGLLIGLAGIGVGTDIFYGLLTLSSAAALHLWMGHVDGGLWVRLLLGSLPGVFFGSPLAGRISEEGYGWTFSALYLSNATRLMLT